MHAQEPVDFIEVIHNAVPAEVCAAIVTRLRASDRLQPGAVGSGIYPELKRSKDLRISSLADWGDVESVLQQAVFSGLLSYLGPHLPASRRDQPAVVRGRRGRLSLLALRALSEGCAGRNPAPPPVVDVVPQR